MNLFFTRTITPESNFRYVRRTESIETPYGHQIPENCLELLSVCYTVCARIPKVRSFGPYGLRTKSTVPVSRLLFHSYAI